MKIVLRGMTRGADDQGDVSSHDTDVIAYESNETRSPSIEVSSPSDPVANLEIVTEGDSVEPAMEVEVIQPRRSARDRKQTQLFGNPLLHRITYHLTPRVVPELLQHLSDTMESLKDKYSGTVEF